jgi:hypothetical protein
MSVGTIFLIHGIGEQKRGYSKEWQENILHYMNSQKVDFVEVYWQDLLDRTKLSQKEIMQTELYKTLYSILIKRQKKVKLLSINWVRNVVFDFVFYLTKRNLQERIKSRFRNALMGNKNRRPLSIISHSWGTVISYDVLFDLSRDDKVFSVDNLFTLGSPLWLLKEMDAILSLFNYRGAENLENIGNWVNVYAKGDIIGDSLSSFNVDADFEVPFLTGLSPHSSYLVRENKKVLKDIIAHTLIKYSD